MNQVSISFTNNGSSSSSSQRQQHTQTPSFSIESTESSIRNLLRNWHRRQKWNLMFNSPPPQDLNRSPWRTHLANFLESTPIHALALLLLIVDLILTIIELSSLLATQETLFHYIGIAILSLLCAKTVALSLALGGAFFRRPGYVVDGVVLIGALVMEVLLEKIGGGLLVVVSLWRVVRVVESAFELSDEAIEAQIQVVVCQFEMLREENRKLLEIIDEKDEIIQKLKDELDQCICHSCMISTHDG